MPTPPSVPDLLPYRTLVWLDYRLAAVFAIGLPLVLLIWAAIRQERALLRLLGIFWKVASLLLITVLLLTDNRPLGYLLALVAHLLVVASVWFWVDLNEELADLPPGGRCRLPCAAGVGGSPSMACSELSSVLLPSTACVAG